MKYRSDFVTNSSSSSYIIACRQTPTFDEETLKKYPVIACINKLAEIILSASGDCSDTDEGQRVTNQSELNSYFIRYYGRSGDSIEEVIKDDDWVKDKYEKSLEAINRGCTVIFKEIDYADNTLTDLIRELSKANIGIEIIGTSED